MDDMPAKNGPEENGSSLLERENGVAVATTEADNGAEDITSKNVFSVTNSHKRSLNESTLDHLSTMPTKLLKKEIVEQ